MKQNREVPNLRERILYIGSAFNSGLYFVVNECDKRRDHHCTPASVERLNKLLERYRLQPKRVILDFNSPVLYYAVFGKIEGVQR